MYAYIVQYLIICLGLCLSLTDASALPDRKQATIATASGPVVVEGFENCEEEICPAVLILSGSRGFGSNVYEEIGQTFQAAGMNAYLVHVLSPADLNAVAKAGSAKARIAYYAKRTPHWVSAVRDVVAYLKVQPNSSGKVGIMGVSLGAQIAFAASVGQPNIDALALVDGGPRDAYSEPFRELPPLLLIWGGNDRVFSVSGATQLKLRAQKLGGPVEFKVYDGGAHDFFLKSGTRNATAAHQQAISFFTLYLSR
jgi:dienelactone hydrolase